MQRQEQVGGCHYSLEIGSLTEPRVRPVTFLSPQNWSHSCVEPWLLFKKGSGDVKTHSFILYINLCVCDMCTREFVFECGVYVVHGMLVEVRGHLDTGPCLSSHLRKNLCYLPLFGYSRLAGLWASGETVLSLPTISLLDCWNCRYVQPCLAFIWVLVIWTQFQAGYRQFFYLMSHFSSSRCSVL